MKTETERLREAEEDYQAQKQKTIEAEEEHRRKIEELCSIAGNEAVSTDTRREALNRLEMKYPDIFASMTPSTRNLKHQTDQGGDSFPRERQVHHEPAERARCRGEAHSRARGKEGDRALCDVIIHMGNIQPSHRRPVLCGGYRAERTFSAREGTFPPPYARRRSTPTSRT